MSPDEIIKTITERVRDTAHVRVVFGDPFTIGEVTIIPVASIKVAGGGGGGLGKARAAAEQLAGAEVGRGLGLGLKIIAKPMGYIEVKAGNARLVPIVDATKIAVGGMIVSSLLLVSLIKLLKVMTLKKLYKLKIQKMKLREMHQQA